MGLPNTPSPPHLYPRAIQLKLYQAFIFSIPILFSIILFLLFYLFYLKRRAPNLSASPPILPRTMNHATAFIRSPCDMGLKGKLKERLPTIWFDEDLKARDSLCCVCLGEFEIKEELIQIPSCKHLFHTECIHHWLCSNSTCPLCRCSVYPTSKLARVNSQPHPQPQPPQTPPSSGEPGDQLLHQNNQDRNHHQNLANMEHQQSQQPQHVIQIEESSSSSSTTCLEGSISLHEFSCLGNDTNLLLRTS